MIIRLWRLIHDHIHTKAFIRGVFTDEVGTFGGLLGHSSDGIFVRFHILDRLGLLDKVVNISHNLKEVTEVVIAILLVLDDLD